MTCEFHGEIGQTFIYHDHPDFGYTSVPTQSDGCTDPGCYNDEIMYNATMDQIVGLIEISASCEQTIVLNCTNNRVTDFAWWTDRKGTTHKYWHGDYNTDTEGCYCSLEGNGCINTHNEVTLTSFVDSLIKHFLE